MPQSSLLGWLNNKVGPSQTDLGQSRPSSTNERHGDALSTPSEPTDEAPAARLNGSLKRSGDQTQPGQSLSNPNPPPNVSFRACTKEDISQLKRLHTVLFPIAFPDSFFRAIHEDELTNSITLLAFWRDDGASTPTPATKDTQLIGAIRCRLLNTLSAGGTAVENRDGGPMLYLSTLALLAPYRKHGIATHMLDTMTKRAVDDYGVTSVGAHVWEANAEALEWYRCRGFTEIAREHGYYQRLQPQGAVVVQRRLAGD